MSSRADAHVPRSCPVLLLSLSRRSTCRSPAQHSEGRALQLPCAVPCQVLAISPRETACRHAQMRSVEASLRLDAVASAGLRVSRAKAADLAKRGDLRCGCPGQCAKALHLRVGCARITWPPRQPRQDRRPGQARRRAAGVHEDKDVSRVC